MTIISQNKRYYPHDLSTKFNAVNLYRNGNPISFVCRRYKISKVSLMRWNKKFDGTKESLIDKSHKPITIQTDNGMEFTYTMNTDKTHPFDSFCNDLNIEHKLIRPRTLRHNDKVERSHRNDSERFYNFLSFYSYDDLKYQMKNYLKRSNNTPMQTLDWLTPLEMRQKIKTIFNN